MFMLKTQYGTSNYLEPLTVTLDGVKCYSDGTIYTCTGPFVSPAMLSVVDYNNKVNNESQSIKFTSADLQNTQIVYLSEYEPVVTTKVVFTFKVKGVTWYDELNVFLNYEECIKKGYEYTCSGTDYKLSTLL